MKTFAAVVMGMVITTGAMAKCENMSLKEMTPTKFEIYHTDKGHKTASTEMPIKFELDHDELSQSETLFHISHHKKLDKSCMVHVANGEQKFTLKQKEYLYVTGASYVNDEFTMKLDHPKLSKIVCKGVSTMGDLKDTMEPYLMFACKDRLAYTKVAKTTRLPASTK